MKKFFDKGLNIFKNDKLVGFFKHAETWSEKIGLICLYVCMPIVGIGFCYNYGAALNKVVAHPALLAVGFIIACFLFGYIAEKMLEYVRPSIDQAKTNIVNGSFFDVLAFLFGIITLISGIVAIVLLCSGEFQDFVGTVAVCILTLYFVTILTSPEKMLNVQIKDSATPAQSLISLVSFLVKAAYRMVPVAFGVALVFAVVNGIDFAFIMKTVSPLKLISYLESFGFYALLPLIGYFAFLTYYFVLDLCMSLFRIADAVEGKNKAK